MLETNSRYHRLIKAKKTTTLVQVTQPTVFIFYRKEWLQNLYRLIPVYHKSQFLVSKIPKTQSLEPQWLDSRQPKHTEQISGLLRLLAVGAGRRSCIGRASSRYQNRNPMTKTLKNRQNLYFEVKPQFYFSSLMYRSGRQGLEWGGLHEQLHYMFLKWINE